MYPFFSRHNKDILQVQKEWLHDLLGNCSSGRITSPFMVVCGGGRSGANNLRDFGFLSSLYKLVLL